MNELMATAGLGRRSIYRYMHSFKAAGFNIEARAVNGGRTKRWRLLDRRQWMSLTGIA
jgi:predicted DNA-binding transcriptional regulator AlpA